MPVKAEQSAMAGGDAEVGAEEPQVSLGSHRTLGEEEAYVGLLGLL